MTIRPNLQAAIPALPAGPPLDAEEYFADYDHEAVLALSRKTLICPATYNRRGTVKVCVGATNSHKLEAKLYIHDDGSDEYDVDWLSQFGDRVFRHPRSRGGKQGVKDLRSNIVKSIMGDYVPDTFLPWLTEDFGPQGPEYLYMVDSDGYHDPHFFYRIHEMLETPNWGAICLYNAKFHAPRGRKVEKAIHNQAAIRGMGAGISMFFRMESFRKNPRKVQVPDRRGWDGFYSREIALRRVATSLVSYVEHLGKWGFHNKGNFDRCRALNPTEHLVSIRGNAIKEIEAEHARTAASKGK
jgi:hypothetical protein